MTASEAQAWIVDRFGRERLTLLSRFVDLVLAENECQNLIAPSTVSSIWVRHVVDSAQLIPLADAASRWLDVGTGGGFPGMVAAILHRGSVTMVEPRRRRAEFLSATIETLALPNTVTVIAQKVERATLTADVISARAVASPEKLLQATRHCATEQTRWLLPRGQSDILEPPAGMMFHVKHSITDPSSSIVVMEAALA